MKIYAGNSKRFIQCAVKSFIIIFSTEINQITIKKLSIKKIQKKSKNKGTIYCINMN